MAQISLNDLMELCRHLKQEKLFVNAEKEQLITLHTAATASAEQLYQKSWIARQQKQALNKLILASGDTTPAACCLKVNAVESAAFVDGYRQLTYHETKIGRFLKQLRESPRLVAVCLIHAESVGAVSMQQLASIVMSGLYGNLVMPDDENFALQVVRHLIDIQVVHCEDPRRLLRRGSCAFSVMYRLLTESLFSARLYLTAALHKPVIQLLMEDEWFYDIDPARALHRFPAVERQRRFGAPGSPEYERKTREYRELITDKLVTLVERFIASLQANMYCFPPSLAWIVSHLYHTLTKVGRTPPVDAQAICADLVVTYFVCPAVCDPEPYGITSDAPIGYIARHNLMQVGQILQVLAVTSSSSGDLATGMSKNGAVNDVSTITSSATAEEFSGKTNDLYAKFTKGCMSFLLDGLLDAPCTAAAPPTSGSQLSGFSRAAAIMSSAELVNLTGLVYGIIESLDESSSDRTDLEELVVSSGLPQLPVLQTLCGIDTNGSNGRGIPIQSSSARSSPNGTPLGTPPSSVGKKSGRNREKRGLFLTASFPEGLRREEGEEASGYMSSEGESGAVTSETVLVISLGVVNECPGLSPETKVLDQEVKQKKVKYNSLLPGDDDPVNESDILAHEKRTRFSLSHDQDSIATSDNLEAISEAASSHSVGSDLDNENDNLSDMVSANVSGRGTPNISGRDTPVSQAGSQVDGAGAMMAAAVGDMGGGGRNVDERVNGVRLGAEGNGQGHGSPARPPTAPPDLPVIVHKTNREDVTDRFGKFEIRQELERDETKSTVSDTWSTDVLASDSEPPEQNQLERLEELEEEQPQNLNLLVGVREGNVLEMSETASDAWSTDVLASDTSERQSERLLELDQDDIGSVSSRSAGVGSEVSELAEAAVGEDVSQASGPQSPRFDSDGGPLASPREYSSRSHHHHGHRRHHERQSAAAAAAANDQSGFRMRRYMADDGDFSDSAFPFSRKLSSDNLKASRGRHSVGATGPPRTSSQKELQYDAKTEILNAFDPLELGEGIGGRKGKNGRRDEVYHSGDDDSLAAVGGVEGAASRRPQNPAVASISDKRAVPVSVTTSNDSLNSIETSASDVLLEFSVGEMSAVATLEESRVIAQRGNTVDLDDEIGGILDSGIDSAEVETLRMGSSVSVDTLTNELSDGLKLTEQQNERLNEKRLSVAASPPSSVVALFDPLARAGDDDDAAEAGDMGRVTAEPSFNAADRGARPKTTIGIPGVGVMPKISVSQAQGSRLTGYAAGVGMGSGTGLLARSGGPATGVLVSLDGVVKDDENKSRKSIFHAFRDKLSKGSFQVPVQAMKGGSKRKPTKHGEKDETFRPTIVIESERADESVRAGAAATVLGDEGKQKNNSPQKKSDDARSISTSNESMDDILAKYRKKSSVTDSTVAGGGQQTAAAVGAVLRTNSAAEEEDGPPAYDPSCLETCKAFIDAKRKLRLVLSNADFQITQVSQASVFSLASKSGNLLVGSAAAGAGDQPKESELVLFLKMQLAEAINLQDRDLVAQLHETIRCLRQFDSQQIKKLLKVMREEYRSRAPYIAYLIRCRQGLLCSISVLDHLLVRTQRDKAVVNKYLLSVLVRLFLEKKEMSLMKFISDFQRLSVADEKNDLVEAFLAYLQQDMDSDPVWQVASDSQLENARLLIERNVMSHVYTHAMFPNGDGDVMRDQILHDHMKKLAKVITTSHKDLRIPKVYQSECPWPAAQTEIYMINAYKTPRDKLQCILRCSSTIMNLLSMANERSVPAADDFMPVLIYVLLKANPPSILSTVQYIRGFYEKRLSGEEQYWWMQFVSAIEFIKTMDYNSD